MKRFYNKVQIASEVKGFAIQLDGRPVKTPARNLLILPTKALAGAIAAEWEAQGEDIDPATMPLTALAQGALDQVVRERERIVSRIAGFADSDMLYFRAEETQQALADHQAEKWDPLLEWARARFDVSFHLVRGIMHESQPDETIIRLGQAVEAQDDFTIAAMLSLVGLSGSLVATLALVETAYDAQTLWSLANLEELWQEEQWGRDDLAVATREIKRAEFEAAVRFLELARS
ncbi:ATP12 family chaperone protein [Parasphingorhabdus halotolerans]|uniref:ATPase n=1 Tax=Parasphingorhabdus halotolerans TaxID=2725558 RepID=A0A6H2DQ19_9SPHN|nr:ATP12 family protein [Parasphingorhabdus halotolerans]QJB70434.1 ATPase [Parasphingorhabdus halotolerans]